MKERSITFRVDEKTYAVLEERAVARAWTLGKCTSLAAVVKRMIEEHLRCERREKRNAKKRASGDSTQNGNNASIDSLKFGYLNSTVDNWWECPPHFNLSGDSNFMPIPIRHCANLEVSQQDGKKDDVVTPQMIQEVIDASMIMTFIDEFRAWRRANEKP